MMKTAVLKQTIIIPADPEKVYDAFMDSKIHSEFTRSKATGKPVVGAKFTAWDGYIFGKNLELAKTKKIVQEWQTTDWPKGYGPSRFELTFKKVKDGTEITMIHSDIPQEQKEELAEGWNEFYWTPLKEYFKKRLNRMG
jgi:activator of HSP90 ATPase